MPRLGAERETDHAPSRHPPKTRHCQPPGLSLIVRAAIFTIMSFAIAFGFLAGANSPAAHYDPYMFAIGVASLFGAACGAIGILISRIRQMKCEQCDFETRLDEAADRDWEQGSATSFLRRRTT
jgi:hypothetical protein